MYQMYQIGPTPRTHNIKRNIQSCNFYKIGWNNSIWHLDDDIIDNIWQPQMKMHIKNV